MLFCGGAVHASHPLKADVCHIFLEALGELPTLPKKITKASDREVLAILDRAQAEDSFDRVPIERVRALVNNPQGETKLLVYELDRSRTIYRFLEDVTNYLETVAVAKRDRLLEMHWRAILYPFDVLRNKQRRGPLWKELVDGIIYAVGESPLFYPERLWRVERASDPVIVSELKELILTSTPGELHWEYDLRDSHHPAHLELPVPSGEQREIDAATLSERAILALQGRPVPKRPSHHVEFAFYCFPQNPARLFVFVRVDDRAAAAK